LIHVMNLVISFPFIIFTEASILSFSFFCPMLYYSLLERGHKKWHVMGVMDFLERNAIRPR